MELSKAGKSPASLMQRMLHNNFLLLAMTLAVATAVSIGVGIFRLIG